MRALLISNSGRPFLEHCREAIADVFGPARRVGFVTAASLNNEKDYCERAREALAPVGLTVEHVHWNHAPLAALERVEAIFVGGGNTYALLKRLHRAKLIDAIRARVLAGTPYVGSSAGSNLAGPTILTTNDWNVVALERFDALGLVPFNVNPHYLETDPAMAAHSETRDDRIREYHVVNANPVVGIEEGTWIRVEDGIVTVGGRGRVKVFRRGAAPQWHRAGERISLESA
jgi:dipeptidase E